MFLDGKTSWPWRVCSENRSWRILNGIPLETLVLGGRVYGGGLQKLEPKELAQLMRTNWRHH